MSTVRCDADVSVISKFGENEFKSGDKERGRTYFESVLENAVRRVDIWSVYIDMEIKYGDEDRTECVEFAYRWSRQMVAVLATLLPQNLLCWPR